MPGPLGTPFPPLSLRPAPPAGCIPEPGDTSRPPPEWPPNRGYSVLQGARAHATLCHIADPLERDTSFIADSAAATGHCPACGAPVGPNSRFCPQCGAALAIAAPPADQATETPPPTDQPATAGTGHCPACGAPVSPRSRFCPQCGAALAAAKSRKPAPPRRARRRRLPVLLGVLLLGLVAAGAVALWLRTTDEGETPTDLVRESTLEILGAPPGPGPSGLERHAPVRLSHPTGAELVVSPGEIFYSDYLDLRALPQPPAAPAWAFFGNAYTFVSITGVVHPDPIEIRLPRAGATDGATIVALTPSGAWVPLPTTDEGSQLKATIQGIPAPWYVAVATPRPVTSPSSGDPSTDPEVEQLLELERLAYTDRAAWNDAALAWLEANPPEEVEEPLEGGPVPPAPRPPSSPRNPPRGSGSGSSKKPTSPRSPASPPSGPATLTVTPRQSRRSQAAPLPPSSSTAPASSNSARRATPGGGGVPYLQSCSTT
mgnify:CR=1 FL=1